MSASPSTFAITVLAHRDPDQLATLLGALRHPRVRIYLHVDSRADSASFRSQLPGEGIANVTWLKSRRTRWGGIEIVDAQLDALARAVADNCDYFMVISGQDFPLRPVGELVDFISENRDRTFIDHTPLPSDRYPLGGQERTDFYSYTVLGRRETHFPPGVLAEPLSTRGKLLNAALGICSAPRAKRRFPPYLKPFGGEMWVNLSRDAADFVLDFTAQHPDYRRYHKHTLLADELFFPSILAGSHYASEHDLVNDDLRYILWPEPRGNHPRTLTLADAPAMLESNDLFARKIVLPESAELVAELEHRVLNVG